MSEPIIMGSVYVQSSVSRVLRDCGSIPFFGLSTEASSMILRCFFNYSPRRECIELSVDSNSSRDKENRCVLYTKKDQHKVVLSGLGKGMHTKKTKKS